MRLIELCPVLKVTLAVSNNLVFYLFVLVFTKISNHLQFYVLAIELFVAFGEIGNIDLEFLIEIFVLGDLSAMGHYQML